MKRNATSRATIRMSATENAKSVPVFAPSGCGRKMDPRTGLFFPNRSFNPMGTQSSPKQIDDEGSTVKSSARVGDGELHASRKLLI